VGYNCFIIDFDGSYEVGFQTLCFYIVTINRIGLTIGSIVHIHLNNPNTINTPNETTELSAKKHAYIVSIVLSSLALLVCCIPFLGCSVFQLTTLKKLVKIGSSEYDYHLLLASKEPGNSTTPYTDYTPNDVPLMQGGLEDD